MKRSFIILVINVICVILLFCNISLATNHNKNNKNDLLTNTQEVFDETNSVQTENEIIPISTDIDVPLSEDSEYLNKDLYLFEETISIENSVNGNLYVIGKDVDISSNTVVGNIFIIAENVTINSNILGSAYIIADEIKFTKGASDAYLIGNKVTFEEEANIYRDARILADTLNLNGTINRDLYSSCKTSNINGSVAGTFYYSGILNKGENIKLNKIQKFEVPTEEIEQITESQKTVAKIFSFITNIFTALIVIIFILVFSKNILKIRKDEIDGKTKYTNETNEKTNYALDIITGFAYLILIPIVSLICMITGIGLPLGFLILTIYIVILCISMPVASLEIAKKIKIQSESRGLLKFGIGFIAILIFVIINVIKYIPFIGGITKFIIMLFGFKTILKYIFKTNSKDEIQREDNEVAVTK